MNQVPARPQTTTSDGDGAPPGDHPIASGAPSEAPPDSVTRQIRLLLLACAAMVCIGFLAWMSYSHALRELEDRVARSHLLLADARRVAALKRQPHRASEALLAQADLLERVTAAMTRSNVGADALVSAIPQTPRPVPGTDYAEMTYQLLFHEVTIESLVRLCHELSRSSLALRVSALDLRARDDRSTWDADLSVSYRVLRPSARSAADVHHGAPNDGSRSGSGSLNSRRAGVPTAIGGFSPDGS